MGGALDDQPRRRVAPLRTEAAGGPAVTPAEAVAYALEHLSEKLSVFPEREVKRVALFYGLGSVTPDQVAAELPRQGVITGEIELFLGDKAYQLSAGDTFCFRSEVGHGYRNRGKSEARILFVNTPPTF